MTTERWRLPDHADLAGNEFWNLLRDGVLAVPNCESCDSNFFPPAPTCPECGSGRVQLVPTSGRGEIYSWVVVHRALDPDFADEVPYTIVAVDLSDGARVLGRLLRGDPSDDRDLAGQRVEFEIFRRHDQSLVGFRLAEG